MPKWIFLEDYDLDYALNQGINLDFAVSISLHADDGQLVIFSAGGQHTEPHILKFKSKELCDKAYESIKIILNEKPV